ncbi:hypothetical protein PTTG_30475, partial [Puccinia triticina 1-1 BBBD Race 1]
NNQPVSSPVLVSSEGNEESTAVYSSETAWGISEPMSSCHSTVSLDDYNSPDDVQRASRLAMCRIRLAMDAAGAWQTGDALAEAEAWEAAEALDAAAQQPHQE